MMSDSESLPPSFTRQLSMSRRFKRITSFCLCLAISLGLFYALATVSGSPHTWSSVSSPVFWPKYGVTSHDHTNQSGYPKDGFLIRDGSGFISGSESRSDTLGIASRIFVVSLSRRVDRREQMEILRNSLGARWIYVDAVESQSLSIQRIMDRVRMLREGSITRKPGGKILIVGTVVPVASSGTFRWPENIDALSSSTQALDFAGSELWRLSLPTDATKTDPLTTSDLDAKMPASFIMTDPPTCATNDNNIPLFVRGLPEFKILTLAKIACWSSHLSVIRRIVDGSVMTDAASEGDVSVILEDDIDMEWDIQERLAGVWTALPGGWDVVFLGT